MRRAGCRRDQLREDTAGAGQWRGGFGPVRETRILMDGQVSVKGDGFRHASWGLKGDLPGATGGVELIDSKTGEARLLASKIDNLPVQAGTVLRDLCPSGSGFGPPELRDPDLIAQDRELVIGQIQLTRSMPSKEM